MIDYIDEWKHVQTTDELLVIVASIDLNPKILEQLMKSTSIVLLDNYFKTYYPHAQKFVFTSIEKSKMLGPISKKEESVEELEKKIKKYALLAGLEYKKYSGHSLRSGFATSAAELGAEERSIMAMTGHKTTQMVRRYIQEANLFKNNALNKIKI